MYAIFRKIQCANDHGTYAMCVIYNTKRNTSFSICTLQYIFQRMQYVLYMHCNLGICFKIIFYNVQGQNFVPDEIGPETELQAGKIQG